MFNSATITGEAAQGQSSGQAMEVIEEIARIKEVSPAEVEQATYENVLQLFPKIAK